MFEVIGRNTEPWRWSLPGNLPLKSHFWIPSNHIYLPIVISQSAYSGQVGDRSWVEILPQKETLARPRMTPTIWWLLWNPIGRRRDSFCPHQVPYGAHQMSNRHSAGDVSPVKNSRLGRFYETWRKLCVAVGKTAIMWLTHSKLCGRSFAELVMFSFLPLLSRI